MDACPTNALKKPYCLNANNCIAYQTIENKSSITETIRSKTQKYIFGCDICQRACPQNKLAEETRIEEFRIQEPFLHWTNSDWENVEEENFKSRFNDSVLSRTGMEKLKENMLFVKENK